VRGHRQEVGYSFPQANASGIFTVQSGVGPRTAIERTSCRCGRREQRDLGSM
jgi:hypothetical protein